MFWLECGDKRSGQYVFYDLKLSKESCNIAIPTEYTPAKVADTAENLPNQPPETPQRKRRSAKALSLKMPSKNGGANDIRHRAADF